MGMLLHFRPRAARPLPVQPASGPAEVILFPGVRYERAAETTPPKPARGLKRQRKG